MNATELAETITAALAPLAAVRELIVSEVLDETPPMREGVTHCAACGFHKSTPRELLYNPVCTTPDWHAPRA